MKQDLPLGVKSLIKSGKVFVNGQELYKLNRQSIFFCRCGLHDFNVFLSPAPRPTAADVYGRAAAELPLTSRTGTAEIMRDADCTMTVMRGTA